MKIAIKRYCIAYHTTHMQSVVTLGQGTGRTVATIPPQTFNIIACVDSMRGIGRDGRLPWKGQIEAKPDMPWFVRMTRDSVCIMGRKTFEDVGTLSGRMTIVVGRGDGMVQSLDEALEQAWAFEKPVWVIGGAILYKAALAHPSLRFVYVNQLCGDYHCDVWMPLIEHPLIPKEVVCRHSSIFDDVLKSVHVYACVNHTNESELAYLALVEELLRAPIKQNRTNIPTRGLFARTLRFPLMRNGDTILPLLTTKKMAVDSIVTELLWFLNAGTNTAYLNMHKCRIWNDNASREFLDSRRLDYPEGELGPVYGWQWRQFDATYPVPEAAEAHCDQIANAINLLRTDPTSRRIVISAWNPKQLPEMALPPCHFAFQFVCEPISNGDTTWQVNTIMHMRSADVGLGVPFNIASYALLTHIICKQVGYTPGELVITMADCHMYTNHAEGLNQQIWRWPRQYPKVTIADGDFNDLYKIGPKCITLEGYDPHPAIKLEMAL